MTTKFNAFFRLLMENSFADLPEEAPYGFWVSPSGHFHIVPWEGHSKTAKTIINRLPNYTAEYAKQTLGAGSFLLLKGWARVVCEVENIWYHLDRRVNVPAPKQKQTLEDLAMFYNMQLHNEFDN